MYSGANIYGQLLLYAFAVGAALGALYDMSGCFRDQLLSMLKRSSKTANNKNITSDTAISDHNTPPDSETSNGVPSGAILLTVKTSGLSKLSEMRVRRPSRIELVLNAVLDLCFWAVATASLILLVFQLNFGELRAFVPPVLLLGFVLYRRTLGVPMRALTRGIMRISASLLRRSLALVLGILRVPLTLMAGACVCISSGLLRASGRHRAKRRRRAFARREIALAQAGFGTDKDDIR